LELHIVIIIIVQVFLLWGVIIQSQHHSSVIVHPRVPRIRRKEGRGGRG
jgi:hypothetical protein